MALIFKWKEKKDHYIKFNQAHFFQNLYPTFLRTSPPYSDDAVAMVLVLARLKYRQFVLITMDGDQNGAEFIAAVEALRGQHKINV